MHANRLSKLRQSGQKSTEGEEEGEGTADALELEYLQRVHFGEGKSAKKER